jgi:AraC-type DNA-binding domain-containing proteins
VPELTIAASGLRALVQLAVSKGASRAALVERSRIDPADLENRDGRIAFSKYMALMRAAQELCDDRALALHFGEAVDVSEISIVGALGGTDNIGDAIAQLNRYGRVIVEVEGVGTGDRFSLVRRAGQLWLVDNRGNPNAFPELTESTFARMVSSTRRILGDVQMFKAVHVTHAEPAYLAEYERIFRVPVVFNSEQNGLQIDEALMLSYRLPALSQYTTAVLREHAETLLERLDSSRSTRDSVEKLLVDLLPTGDAQMDVIAGKLGLGRQALFRSLKAEGVTFHRVLDELRHKTALRYLNGEKLSVKRTARLLGFSDSTALSRAFKRWTGSSPRGYSSRGESSESVG